jgi:hypothetical protein
MVLLSVGVMFVCCFIYETVAVYGCFTHMFVVFMSRIYVDFSTFLAIFTTSNVVLLSL